MSTAAGKPPDDLFRRMYEMLPSRPSEKRTICLYRNLSDFFYGGGSGELLIARVSSPPHHHEYISEIRTNGIWEVCGCGDRHLAMEPLT